MKREKLNAETDLVAVVKKARKDEKLTENEISMSNQTSTAKNTRVASPTRSKISKNETELISKVKQEATSETDIQSYAHRAMNELLGLYGYDEVAASDIDNLKPKRDLENGKTGEIARDGSPISLQINPRQITMNYNDEEEVACSWCGKSCHAAFSLQEGDNVKSFCSEKCFAACRRAKFKKNRGALNVICDTECSLFGGKINLLKEEGATQTKKTTARRIPFEKPSREKIKQLTETMKRHETASVFDSCEKNKIIGGKKKEKIGGKIYNRHSVSSAKTNLNKHASEEVAKQRKNSPLRRSSSEENANDKLLASTHKQELINSSCSNKRKLSSESMNQQSTISKTLNTSDQLQVSNVFRQYPFLNLYPSPALPMLGLPNLTSSLTGNVKLDMNSFRLGLMAALQQSQAVEQLKDSVNDSGAAKHPPPSFQNHHRQHPSLETQLKNPTSPKIASPFDNEKTQHYDPKANPNVAKSESAFPSPILMIPFPIPVPIPIPFPASATANGMVSNRMGKPHHAENTRLSNSRCCSTKTQNFVPQGANKIAPYSNAEKKSRSNHNSPNLSPGKAESDGDIAIDLSLPTRKANLKNLETDTD